MLMYERIYRLLVQSHVAKCVEEVVNNKENGERRYCVHL
jgi:hypothetical protein